MKFMASNLAVQPARVEEGRAASALEMAVPAMNRSSIWLYPGLGCRHVGMGNDLFGRFPAADRLIGAAGDILGYDVVGVCLEGSGRKHVPPRQEAQVIYVLECAYTAVLQDLDMQPRAVSGHSLGSLAAASACGALDFRTGLELVTFIESQQEELVDGGGQAMGVIIGLSQSDAESLLTSGAVWVANWNSPGQYVVAGDGTAVDAVLGRALSLGATKSRRLPGERALHTPKMEEVAFRLRQHLHSVGVAQPRVPFVSCCTARPVETADEMRRFLGEFLAAPVRWSAAVEALRDGWGRDFVEVGPGNLLANMFRFIDRTAVVRSASEVLDQKASR
jgi:malonyl CoA-acyl carrier protein transacylase